MGTITRSSSGLISILGIAAGFTLGALALIGFVAPAMFGAIPEFPSLLPLVTSYFPTAVTALSGLAPLSTLGVMIATWTAPTIAGCVLANLADKFLERQKYNEKRLNKKLGNDFDVEFYDNNVQAQLRTSKLYNLFHLNRKTGETYVEVGHVTSEYGASLSVAPVITYGTAGVGLGAALVNKPKIVDISHTDNSIPYSKMDPSQRAVADIMASHFSQAARDPRPMERMVSTDKDQTVANALRAKMLEVENSSTIAQSQSADLAVDQKRAMHKSGIINSL